MMQRTDKTPTIRQINFLLKPLRFRVKYRAMHNAFTIVDINEELVLYFNYRHPFAPHPSYSISIDDLWKSVICKANFFLNENDETVENPYVGCRSYEEALVKKDLHFAT